MNWIYTHLLLPVLNVLYVPCDWTMGWTERFHPAIAMSIVGVLSAVMIVLIQKYRSNQKLLGQCNADLKFLSQRIRKAKVEERKEALLRARGLRGRVAMKKFWATVKPALWTIPPILVISVWTGSRLAYHPIHQGDSVRLVAEFEDRAQGFAYVLPGEALKGSPLIAPVVNKEGKMLAEWTLQADKAGDARIEVRYGGRTYEVMLPIVKDYGRPPDPPRIEFQDATPAQDQLMSIAFDLHPKLPAPFLPPGIRMIPFLKERGWNPEIPQWVWAYFIVAIGVTFLLRWMLKVH